jgi:hypothetical protein
MLAPQVDKIFLIRPVLVGEYSVDSEQRKTEHSAGFLVPTSLVPGP